MAMIPLARRQTPHPLAPLREAASHPSFVVLVDVDSLCAETNGRIGADVGRALDMLAGADTRVVLVSTCAQVLAASLHAEVERSWWCDRTLGWHDGEGAGACVPMPFATVVAGVRSRIEDARVVALSSDRSLFPALADGDHVIAVGLRDAVWAILGMRMQRTRLLR